MNIYVLSQSPRECAQFHCDAHIKKMIPEYTKLLSQAYYDSFGEFIGDSKIEFDIMNWDEEIYNKKCGKWTKETLQNWQWLCRLAFGLLSEYYSRFAKRDESHPEDLSITSMWNNPPDLPFTKGGKLTERPRILGHYDITEKNIVKAYREYYLKDKVEIAEWKYEPFAPTWWMEAFENQE